MNLRTPSTRRLAVAWLGTSAAALALVGRVGVSAQSTPTASAELEPAEYEATIEALQTQVAQLQERVTVLSEKRGATTAQGTETPASTAEAFEVGDQVDVGDWSFTVTGVELAPTVDLPYEQFVARGIYIVVYLTVANNGNQPKAFPYSDFLIRDSSGRRYGLDNDSTIPFQIYVYDTPMYNDLQPGFSYETVVVFDVPADVTGLVLQTEDPTPFSVNLGV